MGDARLIQLARLLGLPRDVVHGQSARGLVDDHATSVAKALFAEALASDDVSDTESMVAYLEDRKSVV